MNYALITGASKGIGKAIAIELAKKNIPLVLIARNESLLQQLSADIQLTYKVDVHYLAIDLSLTNAAETILHWLKTKNLAIYVLVNNAGYGLSGTIEAYSLAEHYAMMQVNMQTPVALTYLLLPELKQQNKAFILNIASAAAYQSVPGLNIYAATKAFMLSFSRGLTYELRNTNISVTSVAPGATDTDFANRANVNGAKAKKMAAQFNMQPSNVARIAVNAMFAQKTEIVAGFVNQLSVFAAWLLPKKWLEKSAASIYDL
jgi:short-subunit dehydrogenase